ncbi:MAG: glycosyltransferase [Gammaproteobacteria bacterium]|nr:glycosyltransferase [Gammaproteobacteria bacterium]
MTILNNDDSGKTPQSLVSVIMNCYNSSKYLHEAIDSVFAQTYQNWEIIFWDNQSTDRSAEIFNSYDDPRLKYFSAPIHTLLGEARNYAISKSNGDLIAFLDCDDRWLRSKLVEQVKLFNRNSNISFAYANYYLIDEKGKRTFKGFKKSQPQGNVFRSFLRHYPVNLQTVMIRKFLLDNTEVHFDPKLDLSEEYDLFMRLLYETEASYIHTPLVEYRIHSAMGSLAKVEKYPKEIEYIVRKFRELIPGFDCDFAEQLNYLNAKIAYWRANAEMQKGSRKMAKKALTPYRFYNFIFFGLYVLTFFPSRAWCFFVSNRKAISLG